MVAAFFRVLGEDRNPEIPDDWIASLDSLVSTHGREELLVAGKVFSENIVAFLGSPPPEIPEDDCRLQVGEHQFPLNVRIWPIDELYGSLGRDPRVSIENCVLNSLSLLCVSVLPSRYPTPLGAPWPSDLKKMRELIRLGLPLPSSRERLRSASAYVQRHFDRLVESAPQIAVSDDRAATSAQTALMNRMMEAGLPKVTEVERKFLCGASRYISTHMNAFRGVHNVVLGAAVGVRADRLRHWLQRNGYIDEFKLPTAKGAEFVQSGSHSRDIYWKQTFVDFLKTEPELQSARRRSAEGSSTRSRARASRNGRCERERPGE